MLSVYYYAYRHDPAFMAPPELDPLPPQLSPMRLHEAVAVLRRGDGLAAQLRRRRAIAKLVGARLHEDRNYRPLIAALHTHTDPEATFETLHGLSRHSRVLRENVAYALPLNSRPCTTEVKKLEVHRRQDDPMITDLEMKFIVDKPFKEVCVAEDPQRWSVCSDFFRATYVAQSIYGSYMDGSGNAFPMPNPPTAGQPWTGVLFEHFTARWGGLVVSSLRNLLEINSRSKPKRAGRRRHAIDYQLKRAIHSRIGLDARQGGLDVDSGKIVIAELAPRGNQPRTQVSVTKAIRFTDRTPSSMAPPGPFDWGELMNYLAPFIFSALLGDSVHDMVCCGTNP